MARGWHIYEGPTSVDGYLETNDAVVVIEGKRTEAGPTTSTTWMPIRHQMLRNIDAAWDIADGRAVAGFFIVEGESYSGQVTQDWQQAARDTLESVAVRDSLPHRSTEEQSAIADAFFGVTTWAAVKGKLGVSARLPHEIEIRYESPR